MITQTDIPILAEAFDQIDGIDTTYRYYSRSRSRTKYLCFEADVLSSFESGLHEIAHAVSFGWTVDDIVLNHGLTNRIGLAMRADLTYPQQDRNEIETLAIECELMNRMGMDDSSFEFEGLILRGCYNLNAWENDVGIAKVAKFRKTKKCAKMVDKTFKCLERYKQWLKEEKEARLQDG